MPSPRRLQLDRVLSERVLAKLHDSLLAQLWGSGRHHLPLAEPLELFALLLERTDHLVAPLGLPFLPEGEPAPPVPLKLHGRYSRAEVFAAFGLLNEARPSPAA